MIAIDTNVLVRLLTGDHPAQSKASHTLFATEDIYIPDTVLLETEWVLRAAFGLAPGEICTALRRVCGLRNVTLSDGQRVAQILDWHEAGFMPVEYLSNALPVAQGDIAQSTYSPQGGADLAGREAKGGAQYPFGLQQDRVGDIDIFGGKERVAGLALRRVVAGQQPHQHVGINRYHATPCARPQPGRP